MAELEERDPDTDLEETEEVVATEAETNNIINFYWVRHAESVSNLYNNKPTDNYPKNNPNLLDKLKKEVQQFLNNDYNNVQKMKTKVNSESTLSGDVKIKKGAYPLVDDVYEYIKEFVKQKNINVTEELKNNCKSKRKYNFESYIEKDLNEIYDFQGDPNNGECIKTVQKLVKQKYVPIDNEKPVISGSIPGYEKIDSQKKIEIAQLYAHWLQNFIPTNFLFQPTLSHMGITQASILGEQFANNDNLKKIKPDIIICSAMVRTMMTAYLTVLFANATRPKENELPTIIYIVPYINEKQHDAKFVFPPNDENKNFYDFADVAIHPDKIEEVANVIKTWFETNYKPLFADIYERNENNGYNPTIPNVTPDGIKFNTDMYTAEGGKDKELVRQVDIKKFKHFFKEKNKEEGSLLNNIKNILVICHGFVIDEIHGETGINLIKNIIKGIDSQEVFNTWGCNTSVFYHPYFINDNHHDPFENACLVDNLKEFNTFNGNLKASTDKENSKYTQLIENLGLDENLLEQIDALKKSIVKKSTEKTDLEKIKPIIDTLKKKYLLYYLKGEYLVRNKATNLRAEDITDFDKYENLISLRPGSLRGDIALITHGEEKNESTLVYEPNDDEPTNGDEIIGGKRRKLPYKKKTKRLYKKYTKKHRMNKFKKYTRNKKVNINKKKRVTRR